METDDRYPEEHVITTVSPSSISTQWKPPEKYHPGGAQMILEPAPQTLPSSPKMTNGSALLSNANLLKVPPSSSRSPPTPLQSLSLGLVPLNPIQDQAETASIGRVKLSDIAPFEGSPNGSYIKAVEALAGSLMRYNAALIEVGAEEGLVMRCALESVRMFFKARAQLGKSGRGFYTYRAGRALEDGDLSPPCMSDAFRCLGKVARAALCAVARHLRLRSDAFNHLLDDTPLPVNEVSSSVLVATYSNASLQSGKGSVGGKSSNHEVEKGLLTLIASDNPGIQVCDPNGHWYLADGYSGTGELLLLTGRALSYATAGLRPASSYKTAADSCGNINGGRASLTFRLMPQSNAVLDCSPIAAAGHVIQQNYQPISVSQFMDDLSAEEDIMCSLPNNVYESSNNLVKEPSLRSILSDPLSGAFLEDAMVVSCGHSFGGHMLKKVLDMARCTLCNAEIETSAKSLIPNLALRSAAAVVKNEDDRRLFHSATLRKRRKEDHGEISPDGDIIRHLKGVQYPFAVSEKVLIKGNRRTPDKFVGRQAVITSQCLNGWYLLKILDSGENVRLQYRSLQKLSSSRSDDRLQSQPSLLQGSS
ncbi:uncharacterized protein LOC109844872 [Asparagus officinalis]|nr:uncharacterized protein LOC109844872 [Asparagus officinalis]